MNLPLSTKILLAEDDNDMRRFLVKALEQAGYRVVAFDNGLSAFFYPFVNFNFRIGFSAATKLSKFYSFARRNHAINGFLYAAFADIIKIGGFL